MFVTKQFRFESGIKFVLGWAVSFLIRLIPFRPPNIEPILAVQMPFSKKFGFLAGFFFAFLNIVLYDIITGKVGIWTLFTAMAYGLLALFSVWYFKTRRRSYHFAIHALYATVLYDAATGLTIGPLFFGQSFASAFFGQIPFTLYHLAGNIAFGALVSPLIYRWVADNRGLELGSLRQLFIPSHKTV